MKKIFKLLMLALVSSFALASCEDVPEPYNPPTGGGEQDGEEIIEIKPEGTGTVADPYNVAAVVALVNDMAADVESSNVVYIKGKVANNTTSEATISQYGNMTFTMIDEGNAKTTFTAFQVYGPEKKKFTSVDQIKEGDEVVVCGKVVNFKGNTPETVGKGQSYVVSINGQGGAIDDQPAGDAIAVSVAEAARLCNALEDGASSVETYSITGYITDVYSNISKGQQSFWMADTQDGGKVLQAYWANLPEGVAAFVKGSKVTITGNLLKYVKDGNVTDEVKNANVVILEEGSIDEGGNGGNTDQPAAGSEISCAKAAELAMAQEDKAESAETYTVIGYITETDGKISRDQQVFWMADTKDGGKVFEAYWANIPDPTKALPVGTKVKMTGKLMRYGSTPEMKNGNVVVLEMGDGGSTGGNDTGSGDTPAGDAGEYGIGVSYTLGANAYDDGKATINGTSVSKTIKIGTSSKAGEFSFKSTTGKVVFYAVTWTNVPSADVKFMDGDTEVKTIAVKSNKGATGNAPYTMTVTEADKYELEVPAGKTITVTSEKRIIFFGLQEK